MTCEYCNGAGETVVSVLHKLSQKKVMVSVPCVCLASNIVSRENKLLQYLNDVYLHPDKIDSQLIFIPGDLPKSPNLIITGHYDIFVLHIKGLIMATRFSNPKPRILFSRSIDIVQDFHVPQDDGISPHLSALSVFDLVIVNFGAYEKNNALAPCMSQMIITRKEEKKPTWIYLPEGKLLSLCEKEYSVDLENAVSDFGKITIESKNGAKPVGIINRGKNNAADFNTGTVPTITVRSKNVPVEDDVPRFIDYNDKKRKNNKKR